MTTLAMIDVSSAQGTIDWEQVAASGIQGAFVKASEGVRYVNPTLPANLAGMSAAGVLRAVYHFALPAWNAPADEAAHFIQAFKPYSQAFDVIALDLEADPYKGTLPADCGPWAETWLSIVEAEFGCKPLVYTNLDLIVNYGLSALAAGDYGLWLASPGAVNADPPRPWSVLAVQQTSWTASVPGIGGAVDADVFFGTAEQFKAYGIPNDVPKPPIDPCSDVKNQLVAMTAERDHLTTVLAEVRAAVADFT